MSLNYYEILGVEPNATEKAIRNRFRVLARENHPDRYAGTEREAAEQKFQEITAALNVLTNAARRSQHDADLKRGSSAAQDPKQLAKVYNSHGVRAMQEMDYKTAVANFDLATKHDSTDAKAFHNLAVAAAKIPAQLRDAVIAAEKAVELEPLNPGYLKDAGMIIKKAGLKSKAKRYLEKALEWNADDVEIQSALMELDPGAESREGGKGLLDSLFRKG